MHWHIDYLRQEADVVVALPVRTADDLEHDLARAVDAVADWRIEALAVPIATARPISSVLPKIPSITGLSSRSSKTSE